MKLKPGHTTTEFWLTAAAGVIGTTLACLKLVDGSWVVGCMAILGGIYTLVRGALKGKEAQK